MNQPTLARRYAFKLLANMASIPVYLAMEAILPRALGPQGYGNYSFATNLFQQMTGFLDMGTSTCFYNALSRRQRETGLVSFYLRLALLIFVIMSFASVAVFFGNAGELLMPGVPLWLAPLAALWAFLTWWGRVLRSMNDAIGATVSSELVRTAASLSGLVILLALFLDELLTVKTLFMQQYIVLGAMAIGFWLVMRRQWPNLGWKLSPGAGKSYSVEFFNYSHPLFVQALLSFMLLAGERWLLQWFDGSAEQGFFALSQKVSMACFLFVSAMTPLVMRELSIAWGNENREEMGRIMARFAPMLYVITAYFSCFTVAEAPAMVRIFGGADFAAAILPVQIMALYPLHQAYGQLAGSVFHATGRTTVLRNLAAAELCYGFAAVWLLLAPPEFYGLGLGAVGLAVKTVLVQFTTVNICIFLASRLIPISFMHSLLHQIVSLSVIMVLAFVCREATIAVGLGSVDSIGRFLVSGVIYSAALGGLALAFPILLGFTRQELRELWIRFGGRFKFSR